MDKEEQFNEALQFFNLLEEKKLTEELINQRYKALCLEYHPDKPNGSNEKVK